MAKRTPAVLDAVQVLKVPPARARDEWRARRAEAERTGVWPVIVGAPSDWKELRERMAPPAEPAALLAEGERFYQALIRREREENEPIPASPGEVLVAWMRAHPGGGPSADLLAALRAERPSRARGWGGPSEARWPEDVEREEHDEALVASMWTRTKRPRELLIALAPTPRPWEVFAWLQFGGFNRCPGPAAQIGWLRRWHERYGAEPRAMGPDWLEVLVERPPMDRDSAWQLARAQQRYCPEGGELDEAAASLLGSTRWYFWWD